MNKLALTLAAVAFVAVAPAFANEEHAAPADATAAEATAAAPAAVETKEVELADGTKVVVEGDAVSVVAADGTKAPAPDGEHKAKDGSTITTKGGKLVH